jgi:hypothetical protein
MSQQWINAADTLVEGDVRYAAVNEDSQAVSESLFFRKGEVFPAPPNGAIGWLQEDALNKQLLQAEQSTCTQSDG